MRSRSPGVPHSVPGELRADLEGATIGIKTRRKDSWAATLLEVIELREDFILVPDSGKG